MSENIKKSRIALQENITFGNLLAFFFATFAGLSLMSFVSIGQDILLNSTLKIPTAQQGSVAGNLQAVREIIVLLSIGIGGILADKISRRFVFCLGFVFISCGFFLFPFASTVSQLIGFYTISGIGAAFITGMLTTLLADYIQPQSRGTINGIQGILVGFGALFTVLFLKRLPKIFADSGMEVFDATRLTYFIVAGFGILVAIILWFALSKIKPQSQEKQSFISLLKEGLRQGKKPGIALSYASAFVSRADLLIVGTFLSLWITQSATAQGMSLTDAAAKSGVILAVGGLSQLFLGPIIGYLCDLIGRKFHRVDALALASLAGGIAWCSFYFVETPLENTVLYLMVLVGIAQISGVITSQVLVAQQAPPNIRGSVIGFFGICGASAQILLNWLGGMLYSNWSPQMAFVLVGSLNFALVVLCIVMRPFIENKEQGEGEMLQN
ncbi:MAG: MFS transporter [Pyrinomonadaceae bacterium]|nr:MFS transporter [Pyrinomonadaceae bacterium]